MDNLPENKFIKLTWRNVISSGASMEKFTTWTVAGVAAILGMIITNLESMVSVIEKHDLACGVLVLILSIVFGVLSKQVGMALQSGLNMVSEIEELLSSEAGRDLLKNIETGQDELGTLISSGFLWPISKAMKKGFDDGGNDPLAGDRKLTKLWCIQLYSNFFHILSACGALVWLSLNIK